MGFFAFALAIVLGIILAKIVIPLPGGGSFALGTSGGPLLAGLVLGHFGNIGPINLKVEKRILYLWEFLCVTHSCESVQGVLL